MKLKETDSVDSQTAEIKKSDGGVDLRAGFSKLEADLDPSDKERNVERMKEKKPE